MVRSINEPGTPTDELSTLASPNEPSPVAMVTSDGSTVYGGPLNGGEIIPPHSEPETQLREVPADTDTSAPDKTTDQPPTPPLGLLSPVDESGLTAFISKSGKLN